MDRVGTILYRVKDNNTWWFYSNRDSWVTAVSMTKWSNFSYDPNNMVEITEKEAFIEIL